ncbi:MAG: lycopene cyclase family protein [Ilumatobacteraceae bacterium]
MAEVLVAGGGPAAWSIAAELVDRGVETALVTPAPFARWPNTYGTWASDLVAAGLEPDTAGHVFRHTAVVTGSSHRLQRSYVRADDEALALTAARSCCRRRCQGAERSTLRSSTVTR